GFGPQRLGYPESCFGDGIMPRNLPDNEPPPNMCRLVEGASSGEDAMKLQPKTQFRILAAVLLAVALPMLAVTLAMLPVYHTLAHLPWQQSFREQSDQRVFLLVFREIFFIAFPCIVALNAWVAWKILQHAKKLPV